MKKLSSMGCDDMPILTLESNEFDGSGEKVLVLYVGENGAVAITGTNDAKKSNKVAMTEMVLLSPAASETVRANQNGKNRGPDPPSLMGQANGPEFKTDTCLHHFFGSNPGS